MHELLKDEARSAGLGRGEVSLRAVDRRRIELWILAVGVLAAITLLTLVTPTHVPGFVRDAPPWILRTMLLLFAAAFMAYVAEKERLLRHIQRVLFKERAAAQALVERADQLVALAEGARAVNGVLDLDEAMARLLDRALSMMDADAGAVLMVEGPYGSGAPELLRVACTRGDGRALGERIGRAETAAYVAVASDKVARRPDVDGAHRLLVVPLVHRDEMLGILEVEGRADREFEDYDAQLLSVFAEYACVGLVNARMYDAERNRVTELTKLDELKSQFLSTVSHELKTPLTAIIGSASVLRRTPVDAEMREEFLESIDRQARRLASMVDQLLVAGRLAEDHDESNEVVDLAETARVVAADLGLLGRIVTIVGPEQCRVRCGSDHLQQILVNLIDNAFKYGEPPVVVEIAVRDAVVVCSVLDDGAGVAPEDREMIFERFHRVDASGSRPGMGLGLAIVRQLTESVGGRVWFDPRPGGGTAVRVALEHVPRQERQSAPGTLVGGGRH